MKMLQRLLLASTIFSSFSWFHAAEARIADDSVTANREGSFLSQSTTMQVAQAAEPEKKPKPKPNVAPRKPAAPPPAARPRPAPPKPAAPPPARPVPPARSMQPERRPVPPPAAIKRPEQRAPVRPGNQTPAATPHVTPGVQPRVTPGVQGQPPVSHGQPIVAPPAAQGPGAPAGGTAPRMQVAPLPGAGGAAPAGQQAGPIAPARIGAGISPRSSQGQPLLRVDQLRGERHESVQGGQTIIREPDRTIIREGNQTIIRHDEADRFRYGARDVHSERRGNDNVTIVTRPNGDRIVTTVDSNGGLLRRSRILPDGREIIIIDNRRGGGWYEPGRGFGTFFVNLPPPLIRIPRDRYIVDLDGASPDLIYDTLMAPPVDVIERPYTLDEIRYSAPLRDRMPRIDLDTVTFDTGSWDLSPDQVDKLAVIAGDLKRVIDRNPSEVFLVEGFTDAVGSDVDNLSLSDRRAETVAVVLSQQFGVPPENLSTQGYGDQYLKIPTPGPERANRRVTIQRITPLLTGQAQ